MKNTGLIIITLIGAGLANAETPRSSHAQMEGKYVPSQPGASTGIELIFSADPTGEEGKPIPPNAFDFKIRNNRSGGMTPKSNNSLN